jgi:exodeoxyribonuclease V beta subunit
MEKEIHGENMRLLYVALTRAKHRCYLAWGAFKGAETSPLAYLFHSRLPVRENSLEGVFPSFSQMSDQELLADIEKCSDRARGSIHLKLPPERTGEHFVQSLNQPESFQAATFSTRVATSWEIGSFSSMMSGRKESNNFSEHLEEYREIDGEAVLKKDPVEFLLPNIFGFPRGTKAGLCLHSILEKGDFDLRKKGSLEELIRDELRQYRFDDSLWLETVQRTLEKVFSSPLPAFGNTFCLADIAKRQCLTEMEFFFPVQKVNTDCLKEIFSAETTGDVSASFVKRLQMLSFQQLDGFFKGFIDLVFEHQGRFYLVDWKSNYLGNRLEDYHRNRLQEVMDKEYYHLQYHLYCLALDKYLRTRIPDYDYERDFGTVFYIFLRGVEPASGPQFGIYQTRPSARIIENLKQLFLGKG